MKKEIFVLVLLITLFSLALVLPAKAIDTKLLEASTTLSNSYITNVSSYDVSFKVASSTEPTAQIRLIFPAGFNVSGTAGATSTIVMSSTLAAAIVASSTVSGQEITLWLADGQEAVANDTLIISGIPNIVNPYTAGSYTLGIETRTVGNEPSEALGVASTTAFSILNVGERRPAADTTPPTSKITSPTDGTTISAGKKYVINGIGTDVGGSTVNRVEISLDDGKNWFSAQSNASGNSYSWEYVWQNPVKGEYTIKARATDEVGNIESPSAGVKVTVSVAESAVVPPAVSPEKPITEMTVPELQAKIVEIQQKVIVLLQQLIQLIQQQIQELLAK